MRYRVKRYGAIQRHNIVELCLVVTTTTLALVARSGVDDSLVDLPLGTGLVTGFGLVKKKKESQLSQTGIVNIEIKTEIHTGIPQGLFGSTLPLDFPRPPPWG